MFDDCISIYFKFHLRSYILCFTNFLILKRGSLELFLVELADGLDGGEESKVGIRTDPQVSGPSNSVLGMVKFIWTPHHELPCKLGCIFPIFSLLHDSERNLPTPLFQVSGKKGGFSLSHTGER